MLYLQGMSSYLKIRRDPGSQAVRYFKYTTPDFALCTPLADPRGTGLRTPFSAELVEGRGDVEIIEYLKHFRADNIGTEAIRVISLRNEVDPAVRKWRSFGGFYALIYLSLDPTD
ncbi:hypothetical protein FB451DRAFT_1412315 [Mycena latifolia]|nr:hypothetical protein FB451DRAFT_1412315 [Mycena latifolia]